jgi:RNA polymerase sigma factor (sigma-70 family)
MQDFILFTCLIICKKIRYLRFLKTYTHTIISEKEVIEGCKTGNRSSMEYLYNLYHKRLRGVVYRYSRTNFDIDDILQEGFIRIFKNIHSFNYSGSFEGWIRRIIINTAINYSKKYIKIQYEVNFENVNEKDLDAIEIADNLSVQELHALISKMPDGYRHILNLYAIDGYSHKEIGELLSIGENSSSSQYFRAKKYLMRLIKESV